MSLRIEETRRDFFLFDFVGSDVMERKKESTASKIVYEDEE